MVLDFSGKLALPVADDNARMGSEIQHLLKTVKFVHHLFHGARVGMLRGEMLTAGQGIPSEFSYYRMKPGEYSIRGLFE
jgi:hypothetical protein